MSVELDSSLAEIRAGVHESLPEIAQIQDEGLRDKVVEVHARALAETRFKRIEDIPASGVPDSPLMKQGTQDDHYRGVATMAIGMARGMQEVLPNVEIDYDVLIAAALTHDVGKAYEYEHWDRWAADRRHTGSPSLRHPAYGAHLALTVGLPEPVVHCVAVHSYMAEGLVCSSQSRDHDRSVRGRSVLDHARRRGPHGGRGGHRGGQSACVTVLLAVARSSREAHGG
jgi:putative nucleotidyltransferase with HDIG domain